MSTHHTGVVAFDTAANNAEATRQSAVSAAATQSAVTSAEITYFRTLRSLALANGISTSTFNDALKSLGVQT
jgi:hypothetical protein